MTDEHKWNAKDIPNQEGKVIIITGANSGIGYEAARALAAKGGTIIMACRSQDKAEQAAEQIRAETPQAELNLMPLNLADLSSVREFAAAFQAAYDKLDILINNAGVMAVPYRKTADGFEMHIGTNHLGHFLLTGLLLDTLKNTPDSRVVSLSSFVHYMGRINFNDLQSEKSYQKWFAYAQSKLANLLFAYQLQRKLAKDLGNPISVAAHPGYSSTNLQRHSGLFSRLNNVVAQSQEMGVLPTLYAATYPGVKGGDFIGPDGLFEMAGHPKVTRSNKASYNEETARKLWEVSEELTGISY